MRLPHRTSVATSVAALLLVGGLSACGGGADDDATVQDPLGTNSNQDTAPGSQPGAGRE